MLIQLPPWQTAAMTTIRPSAATDTNANSVNKANAYDASLTTFAQLVSEAGLFNCQVTYTGFPTTGGSTLPNAGTLTVRRAYSVTKASLQISRTIIEVSLNGGSTWTTVDQSPSTTSGSGVGDVTYAIPSGQSIANIRVRCNANNSADGSITAELDVYDIRIDY